jgi:hypothetical protein
MRLLLSQLHVSQTDPRKLPPDPCARSRSLRPRLIDGRGQRAGSLL